MDYVSLLIYGFIAIVSGFGIFLFIHTVSKKKPTLKMALEPPKEEKKQPPKPTTKKVVEEYSNEEIIEEIIEKPVAKPEPVVTPAPEPVAQEPSKSIFIPGIEFAREPVKPPKEISNRELAETIGDLIATMNTFIEESRMARNNDHGNNGNGHKPEPRKKHVWTDEERKAAGEVMRAGRLAKKEREIAEG